jgi:hypothetical protein
MKRFPLIATFCALILMILCAHAPAAEAVVDVSFAEGAWDPAVWTMAKSPIVDYFGDWIQRDNCIENVTPDDPEKRHALDGTLTTMVYKTPFSGNWTVSATFEIGPGAAPGIVIAQDIAADDQGRPEYGIYYEAIVYEKGINLWYHFAQDDGKRKWHKALYARFPLQPDTPYTLTIQRKGQALDLQVLNPAAADQQALQQTGLTLPTLPGEVYLGIEGCEGICRTLDFKVIK